jgi:hypothetical protein
MGKGIIGIRMAVALAAVICLSLVGIASAQNFPLRVAADKGGFYVGTAVAATPLRNEDSWPYPGLA